MRSQPAGFIGINVQDTDLAGHDEDARRFAAVLELCDVAIGETLDLVGIGDVLLITSDHGNDPTIGHDKHTREFTPLLVAGQGIAPRALAPRESLADIAATIAEIFAVRQPEIGRSFLANVQRTQSAAASDAVAMAR